MFIAYPKSFLSLSEECSQLIGVRVHLPAGRQALELDGAYALPGKREDGRRKIW